MSSKLLKKFFAQQTFPEQHRLENESSIRDDRKNDLNKIKRAAPSGGTSNSSSRDAKTITTTTTSAITTSTSALEAKMNEFIRFDRIGATIMNNNKDATKAAVRLMKGFSDDNKKKKQLADMEDGSGVGNSRSSFKQARHHEPTITKATKKRASRKKKERKALKLASLVRKDAKEKAKKAST